MMPPFHAHRKTGDGCSASGAVESGYLCHVPGRACSLAVLCGNDFVNPGEACDDGDTALGANGCSATCDLSLCGDGVRNARAYPNHDQETCDDGNRIGGDGCSSLCAPEPGFGCTGTPSRCTRSGLALFSTGVDARGRRVETATDLHWFYDGTSTGGTTDVRNANDWPHELPTSRFMAPLGTETCVYQDFMIPSTMNPAAFHVDIATFNDNAFAGARVNGAPFTPTTIAEPAGQPWQKNVVRRVASAGFRVGLNRIMLCNENGFGPPNAFRYLVVDAFDDRCGDGVVSVRERCDDGNVANGDGCSAQCDVESGRACTGAPSVCAATCGNGVVNAGESCDDGDIQGGDGCDDRCRVEPGYSCAPGLACAQVCGNGLLNPGDQCDDGNVTSGDGCSASCESERGYDCVGVPSTCFARCGNGTRDEGELCDDVNRRSGDGCSNTCTLELGYACPIEGVPCVQTCGNGTVNPGERCDDGNLTPGDGCGTECMTETGYACSAPGVGASVCALTCGNGTINANETCDDGNSVRGDGCDHGCRAEVGFSCSGAPSTCTSLCGDGIRASTEACDVGNTTGGSGCSAMCAVESGWVCPGLGTACFHTCGNGMRDNAAEACDDGDATSGDGCSATCAVEPGYVCSGAPSICVGRCGDGVLATAEACDDGNAVVGDGCSARCRREVGEPCTDDVECELRCSPTTQTCTDDDVAPPAPVIVSPPHDSTTTDATPTIAGTAEPFAQVEIVVDDVAITTVTVDAAGNFTHALVTPLAVADHTVRAVATDAAGNEGPASTNTFTVVGCLADEDCASNAMCDLDSLMCVPVVTIPDAGMVVDAGADDAGYDADVMPDGGTTSGGGGCDCGVAAWHGEARPRGLPLGLVLVIFARARRARRRTT